MSTKSKAPLIAIVGRPNVGKSSLFNRMLGKQLSIVDNISGITRDRIFAMIENYTQPFGLIDTGGLSFNAKDPFQEDIVQQVQAALEECQGVIFVVDGQDGLHPLDHDIAQILRQTDKPCVVAVNKVDSSDGSSALSEFYELGFETVMATSAKQNLGLTALVDHLLIHCPKGKLSSGGKATHIAILGRPNVGKSSIINKMLNEERLIVSEQAGTTRDSVDIYIKREGQDYVFIDTAGMRYKRKIHDSIEFYSIKRTEHSLKRCDVALIMINAEEGLTTQDLKIIKMIDQMGKAAAIIINKWDLFSGIHQKDFVLDQLHRIKPYTFLPYIFTSATEGKNVSKILDLVHLIDEEQKQRISTGILNRFLKKIVAQTPPPRRRGKLLKFYYMSQVDRTPPTFQISINSKDLLDTSYQRFVENQIREQFGFTGAPIRLRFQDKKSANEK